MLLLTAMIWGGGFVAQSAGMDYIGPFTFCAARYVLAMFALIPVIFLFSVQVRKNPQTTLWEKFAPDRATLGGGLYCGLTLGVADALQQPLGRVVGDVHVPDGSDGATGTAPAALRGFPLRRLRLRTPRTFAQGSTDMSLNHRDGLIKPSRWVNQTITMGQSNHHDGLNSSLLNLRARVILLPGEVKLYARARVVIYME
jgi:hypothetical protein